MYCVCFSNDLEVSSTVEGNLQMKTGNNGPCIFCPISLSCETVIVCEGCGVHMCLKCNPANAFCPLCAKFGPPPPQLPLRNLNDPAHRPRRLKPRYATDTAMVLFNFFPNDPQALSEVPTMPEIWISHAARLKGSMLEIKYRHALQQIKEMSPII